MEPVAPRERWLVLDVLRGFALFGVASLGLAAIIFAAQIAIAQLWLRRYRFGPLEWVWRALVYLERPPMRV